MNSNPLKAFIIYASEDKTLREEFERHLQPLADLSWLTIWSDKEIAPGDLWDAAIKKNIQDADIFFMLVSVNFYNSGYIREEEFKTAVERLEKGDSIVIPIIVRHCTWKYFPIIKDLQVLPPGGIAVTDTAHWDNRDKAWDKIIEKIGERIEKIHQNRASGGNNQGLKTTLQTNTTQKQTAIINENITPVSNTFWKFRDLKTYGSTEWLADNKKKYRQVFDIDEADYIYAELSFFNKKFDVEDWSLQLELRCFNTKNRKEAICEIPLTVDVNPTDPILYIREGWGNKEPGVFWSKGTYIWEAWIDNTLIANKVFYIEDSGKKLTRNENPYCRFNEIYFYNAPFDDIAIADRKYASRFISEELRYLYSEIHIENLCPDLNWYCEIIVRYFNSAGELKGMVTRLYNFEPGEKSASISAGWGSNVAGSWRKDTYRVEVMFMNQVRKTGTVTIQ